jgi:hypothetical protein
MAPGFKNNGFKLIKFSGFHGLTAPKGVIASPPTTSETPNAKLVKSPNIKAPLWGGRYPPGDPRWNKDYLTGPKFIMSKPKI